MGKGKSLCEHLKKIREQIAEANGIDYAPRKCTFEGDCKGTCPVCERELGYLESQLTMKRNMGVPIKIIGLSVALVSGAACTSNLSATCQSKEISSNSTDYDDDEMNGIGVMEIDSFDDQTDSVDSSSIYIGDEEEEEGDIVYRPDKVAQFPGGMESLKSFLQKNICYPPKAIEKGINGIVVVKFHVNKHGDISDVEVVRSIDSLLDAEAVRVVTSMPRWIPAEWHGKAARSTFRLPINFQLSE